MLVFGLVMIVPENWKQGKAQSQGGEKNYKL
jgi:hypothetical protein